MCARLADVLEFSNGSTTFYWGNRSHELWTVVFVGESCWSGKPLATVNTIGGSLGVRLMCHFDDLVLAKLQGTSDRVELSLRRSVDA